MLCYAVVPCLQGAFAVADPPALEQVPPDAVDSAGKPVNAALYQAFWSLQVQGLLNPNLSFVQGLGFQIVQPCFVHCGQSCHTTSQVPMSAGVHVLASLHAPVLPYLSTVIHSDWLFLEWYLRPSCVL